ncbi:MAG TPA: ion channel [Spirochaetia bacterium]|nr:ion channel [Spirochaetia bacterium]
MSSGAPLNREQFDPGITQSYTGELRRIINRDGTFNVQRRGLSLKDFHVYQFLLSLSWPAFTGLVLALFIVVNAAFAGLYVAVGLENLSGAQAATRAESVLNAFFFSVQTLTTVGYGTISPHGIAASAIASGEAMMGVMGFAFAAGLLYGRFSRPSARILFSSKAVIAPYRDGTSLQFRIANRRSNAIVNLEATVLLMTVESDGGQQKRRYAQLELERSTVYFLPLTWTIVHPINPSSPLYATTTERLAEHSAELLVLITGFDDSFNQVVNARTSYRWDEIIWGARFTPAFHADERGELVLDLTRIDDTVPGGLTGL